MRSRGENSRQSFSSLLSLSPLVLFFALWNRLLRKLGLGTLHTCHNSALQESPGESGLVSEA